MISESHTQQAKSLYLIRHGQTHQNLEDISLGCVDLGLDHIGRRQANLLADGFRERGLTQLISGPLKRSRETAQYIAVACGLNVKVNQQLCDPANLPELRNSVDGENFPRSFSASLENLDHYGWLNQHVKEVVESILEDTEPGGSVAIVSHLSVIRAVIASFFPGRFNNPRSIPQMPGCWNLIGINPGGRYKLLVVNAAPLPEYDLILGEGLANGSGA